jgi:UMF1 family MFS transporter
VARPRLPTLPTAAWWLYDLANTIFSMGVQSLFFPLWVREQVGPDRADRVFGLLTSLAMGVIFLLAPFLGAVSDRTRRRMPFLLWSTLLCVTAISFVGRGPWALSVALFVLSVAAYNAGLQFYDSLLPSVSTPENRGSVSGIGVGLGYVGSFLAVGAGLLLPGAEKPLLFGLVGLSFLLLAIPCFLFVRERENPDGGSVTPALVVSSVRGVIATFAELPKHPGLARFLVGRAFYTDAINTVIAVMGLVAMQAAASEREVYRVMLTAVLVAVPGGFVWGRHVDRFGPKRTLMRVLGLWIATLLLAAAIAFFRLPLPLLYVVAVMTGLGLGGTWTSDRPMMLRLTPEGRTGEFFGLYGMVGRFTAIVGPLVWALTAGWLARKLGLPVSAGQGMALLVLLAFVAIAYRMIGGVPEERAASPDGS